MNILGIIAVASAAFGISSPAVDLASCRQVRNAAFSLFYSNLHLAPCFREHNANSYGEVCEIASRSTFFFCGYPLRTSDFFEVSCLIFSLLYTVRGCSYDERMRLILSL